MMKGKLCRLCCENEATSYIFHTSNNMDLSTKIMYCCPKLDVKEEDELPSFVCEACEQELEVCYQFVLKCENADKYLRSQLSKLHSDDDKCLVSPTSPIDVKIEIKYQIDDKHCYENTLSDDLPLAQHNQDNEISPIKSTKPQVTNVTELQIKTETPVEGNSTDLTELTKNIDRIDQKSNKKNTSATRSFKCSVCARECINRSALVTHIRSHSNYYPFPCSLCDKKYKDRGSLKCHVKKHHSGLQRVRDFICESCGKGFFKQADVIVHMRTHTGETPYACNECSAKFTQLGALNRHKKRHAGEKDHMCSICPKRFCTKEELKLHLAVHSTEKKYQCSICNTMFKHQSNLTKHKKRHLDSHSYTCNYCERGFKFKGNLKLHIQRRHSEKSGYCELCYRHVPNLETHMWRHNGERPYKCEQCSRSFYESRALAHHVNVKHTKTDKYKCNHQSCAMMFPSQPMLDFHIAKSHNKIMPFPCDKCARAFYRKNDLARHKIGTHKEYLDKIK